MSYRIEKSTNELVIDGWEKGVAPSPYQGIANIRNLNTYYYPGVSYVNYKRQACTLTGGTMTSPVQSTQSPARLNYVLDDSGQIWKQSSVNSSSFSLLTGRFTDGKSGIAFWENYLVVFGDGVIEFCGDGTGDGGVNSGNWNKTNYGLATSSAIFSTNFASTNRLSFSTGLYPIFQISDPVQFTTTGILPAPLVVGMTYYVSYVDPFYVYVSTGLNDNLLVAPLLTGATAGTLVNGFSGTTGTYSVTFDNGDKRDVSLTNGNPAMTWITGLTSDVGTTVNVSIVLTSDGSGTQTINDLAEQLPIGNVTNLNVTFSGTVGGTVLTLVSYVNPRGVLVKGTWLEPTGLYNIILPDGQKLAASFTNGSDSIILLTPLIYFVLGTWSVELLDPTVSFYRPYISKVDSSLLFCNGQYIGRLAISSSTNITFNPAFPDSYNVSFGVTSIPEKFTDVVTDMVDLKTQLVVAGRQAIYVWDYISASTSSPSPIGENIVVITNLLNNIYVLAGQKGNIYVSNGYSSQLLFKLPDYISGSIDPIIYWGGIMTHRARLFFQALIAKSS